MTPVVLGIYPSDSFGIDQRLGLRAAFSDSDIEIIDLAAPVDDMKNRNAPELIEGLRTNLEKRNVIAIVGPSITEFTPEVLATVKESGRRPAIVLTTAAARQDIGWEESGLPLFRVGSGVDERAAQFARLARNTVTSGVELVLVYESVPSSPEKTYGELFFARIKDNIPEWSNWVKAGKVRDIPYYRGKIMESFARPQQRAIFDQKKMVVVIGLSNDYEDLAKGFYRADQPHRAALLGGWNASTSLLRMNEEAAMQNDRMFDMTDVFRSPADTRDLPDSRRFQQEFGPLTPAVRQEAVAYDSGLVVKQATEQLGDDITAERLVEMLRGHSFNGITGEITFGEGGQNAGQAGGMRPLYNLSYDPSITNWREIESFTALLARDLARR
jgi:hypothetical protein